MDAVFFVVLLQESQHWILRFFKMLDLPAVAFWADIYPVRDYPGIENERRETSGAKIGEAFLATHQTCRGFPAFYTDGRGFLCHNAPS